MNCQHNRATYIELGLPGAVCAKCGDDQHPRRHVEVFFRPLLRPLLKLLPTWFRTPRVLFSHARPKTLAN